MPRFQTLHRLLLGGLAPALAGLITLTPPVLAQGADTSLASCPARQPVLRVAGVFNSESFSPHPV